MGILEMTNNIHIKNIEKYIERTDIEGQNIEEELNKAGEEEEIEKAEEEEIEKAEEESQKEETNVKVNKEDEEIEKAHEEFKKDNKKNIQEDVATKRIQEERLQKEEEE